MKIYRIKTIYTVICLRELKNILIPFYFLHVLPASTSYEKENLGAS